MTTTATNIRRGRVRGNQGFKYGTAVRAVGFMRMLLIWFDTTAIAAFVRVGVSLELVLNVSFGFAICDHSLHFLFDFGCSGECGWEFRAFVSTDSANF